MASSRKILTLDEAVEDLAKSFGFQAHYKFTIGDEEFVITYKQFLPAEIQRGLDAIDIALESCDKDADGGVLIPLRMKGEPLADSRDAQRLKLIWGIDKYERFKAAGGSPDMLSIVWLRQDTDLENSGKKTR